jgi:hypothetical protein
LKALHPPRLKNPGEAAGAGLAVAPGGRAGPRGGWVDESRGGGAGGRGEGTHGHHGSATTQPCPRSVLRNSPLPVAATIQHLQFVSWDCCGQPACGCDGGMQPLSPKHTLRLLHHRAWCPCRCSPAAGLGCGWLGRAGAGDPSAAAYIWTSRQPYGSGQLSAVHSCIYCCLHKH